MNRAANRCSLKVLDMHTSPTSKRSHFRPTALILALCAASTAWAADSSEDVASQTVLLDPVVVTATRTPEPLSQTAASIAAVTDREITQRGAQTFGEIFEDIPNVMVESPESSIFTRLSIRGSESNQITYVIDGVRQDMTTMAGNHPLGIFLDPELLKPVEVKHGGGSALYGNGGIGGTIALTTVSAADLLKPGETFGVKAKTGYSTASQELMGSAYAFGRANAVDYIFGVSQRHSGNEKLSDGKRSDAGSDTKSTAVFAKAAISPTDASTLSLAYNYDKFDTFYLSAENGVYDPDQTNDYGYEQHRAVASWLYENGPWWDVRANFQYTKARYSMDSVVLMPMGLRGVGNSDDFESWSGNLQNTSRFDFAGMNHQLTYGGDFSRSEQDSLQYNPYTSGKSIKDPSRPDAKSLDFGFFIEDEIALGDQLTIAPQIRYSYFKREAAGFDSFSDGKVTPGLTVTLKPMEGLSFWASANEGFRPPIMDELYYSLSHNPQFFPVVVYPNPDLKPEKSWNYEVGMNAAFSGLAAESDALNVKAAVFYDDVKDFINIAQWQRGPTTCYQAENIGHVSRKGVELSAKYAVGNFNADFAYGLVHVVDKEADKRVSGITPQSVKLQLGYSIPRTALHPWYRFNWYDAADGDKAKNTASTRTKYGAFATHSVGLTWTPKIPNFWDFTAGLAIENVTDEKYRFVNGSYGYGRAARVWVTGRF